MKTTQGTSMAQQPRRNWLSYSDIRTLLQPEVFIHFKDGMIDGDGTIPIEGNPP